MTKLIKGKTKYDTLSEQFKNLKKIVERGDIGTSNTQIHDYTLIPLTHKYMTTHLPGLIAGTSIQSGRVELVFGPKPG